MKRFLFILAACLLLFPAGASASSIKTVHIKEATPVFKEGAKVAVFIKGSVHAVTDETDKYYYTAIGGEEVKFSKRNAAVKNGDTEGVKALHPIRAKTVGKADVLEKPSLKAKPIGTIQPNETIHVQRIRGNYYPVNFGGKTGYIRKNQLQIETGVPVLMYHDIVKEKHGSNVSELELARFKEQMDYLKSNGWTTISPKQLEDWVNKKGKLPPKSVLITFDDGYAATIDLAYPILKKHGFQATSFLITSRIGRSGMVAEGDLVRTQDVYSYQNHTHQFHMFNTLTNLSSLQSENRFSITADLEMASGTIDSMLGKEDSVYALAYPYGKYSKDTLHALRDTGITIAFTINEGNVFQGDPIYALNRQRVHSSMSLKEFAQKLIGR